MTGATDAASRRRSGVLAGVGAYVWWGLCPGFFPLLLPAGSLEVLAHRILWSALSLFLVLVVARRLGDLRRLSGRTWLLLLAASALISVNWGIYIWAATNGTSSMRRWDTSSIRWSPWRSASSSSVNASGAGSWRPWRSPSSRWWC